MAPHIGAVYHKMVGNGIFYEVLMWLLHGVRWVQGSVIKVGQVTSYLEQLGTQLAVEVSEDINLKT